jgi:methyltransferase (TIGR00027 family)
VRFLEERYSAMAHDAGFMSGPTLVASRASVTGRSAVAEAMLDEAVAEGMGQLVILGAGYDSYAWRRPDVLDRLTVFEVDHPATQARKRAVTASFAPGAPPVRFVAVDFERQVLADALAEAGWRADEPTFFTWQGVTMYLTDAATFATLGFVAGAAPGSTIVFQYHVAEDLLPSEVLAVRRSAVAGMARSDEPWINTYRPSELVLRVAALGFSRVSSVGADELNPRLFDGRTDALRWPEVSALCVAHV